MAESGEPPTDYPTDTSLRLTTTNSVGFIANTSTIQASPTTSTPIAFPSIMKPFRTPERPLTYSANTSYLLYVRVFHPFHPPGAGRDPMLRFLTSDGGAQYLMVYYACCILAGNCMKNDEGRDLTNLRSPFLSSTAYIKDRINVPVNDILETGDYYFIVPQSPPESPSDRGEHYAITPTFDDWDMPKVIPSPWHEVAVPLDQSDPSPAETRAAEPCYLSSSLNSVQQAHIIPGIEVNWAKRNQIGNELIGLNKDVLEDWRNKIPIRSDLHHQWDHGFLTFLPKSISGTAKKVYKLCVHVNRVGQDPPKGYENIELYQNRIIQNLHGVPANFLFARFAWAIFNEEVMCLFRTKERFYVRVKVPNENGEYDEEYGKWYEQKFCKRTQGSSRIYSPRVDRSNKRKRSGENDDDYLSSSGIECDGYLSATDVSSPLSTYNSSFDDISEYDSADDTSSSNGTDCDETIPRRTQPRNQDVEYNTFNHRHPTKRRRPSPSSVISKDLDAIASKQAAKGDGKSSPSPENGRTPDLSRSVETLKTDKDVTEETNNSLPQGLLPLLPTIPNQTHDRSPLFEKGKNRSNSENC